MTYIAAGSKAEPYSFVLIPVITQPSVKKVNKLIAQYLDYAENGFNESIVSHNAIIFTDKNILF
jgi:hypothetical protein